MRDRRVAIAAGQSALIATRENSPPVKVAPVGDTDPLAWRQGGLAFNETPVSEAAAEFNRYNRLQIDVAVDSVGERRMTGYFQIDKPDQFAEAVAEITAAKVTRNGNTIVIK